MKNTSLARSVTAYAGVVVVVALSAATPAWAAVTVRGTNPEDGPRLGWFDRYTEMRQGPEQSDKVTETVKVGDGAGLDLSHLSGDIRVTVGSGSEIRIEATKRARSRTAEDAARLLREVRVEINNYNGRVEVRTVLPRRGMLGNNISTSVDYAITVPAATAVALRAISGNISVTGVKGEVRAESVSGDVTVANAPNVTVAKSISGDVTTRDVATQSTLLLSSVSGSVTGTGVKARALEAGSISGNVRLAGSEIERAEAKSVSGNIEFDAPLAKGGRYEFTSHSGNVRVVTSGNTGFELDADSFGGNVRSEVPLTMSAAGRREPRRPAMGDSSRSIRGSFGDAGAFLSIRTHSGSVVVARK